MQYKRFNEKIFVRIDKGEEIVKSLTKLCKTLDIQAGIITGLGATDKVTIGIFDVKTKKYHSNEFIGDYEIAPLYGNISRLNNEVYLHLHINICNLKHQSFGGHLNSAVVSATFEGVIEEINGKIDREFNAESGLNLIKF